MEFNTSVAQPSGAALDIKPPASPSPMEIIAQMQEPRIQQAKMQMMGIEQQQMKMQMDERKAINEAYQNAFSPQADGTTALDMPKLTSALALGGHGSAIPGITKSYTDYQTSLTELGEHKQKLAEAEANTAGRLASSVKQANYDPNLFHTGITEAIHRGVLPASVYAPLDQQIQKSLQDDPTGEQARKLIAPMAESLIAQSPEQQKLANEAKTAEGSAKRGNAAQTTAETGQKREARESSQADLKNAASDLAISPNAAEYTTKLNALPHGLAIKFPSADQVFDKDGTPIDDGVQRVRFVGMTPAEQSTASKTPKESNPTEASLAAIATDPNKTPAEREAASAALRRMDQSRVASRPVIQTVIPGLGGPQNAQQRNLSGDEYLATLPQATAAQVRAVAEGRDAIPPASTRSQAGQALRNAVYQYDPTFTEERARIRRAFTTGPDGRNIGNLNTAPVHLDQLGEIAKALENGSFRPGNKVWNDAITMFGGSAPTNFEGVKTAVAGEMASALKGNATDPEIAHISATIQQQNSPKQLADFIESQLHVLGAKLNTYNERFQQQAPGDSWSPVMPSARKVFQKHGFDPITGPGSNAAAVNNASSNTAALPQGGGKKIDQATAKKFYEAAGRDPAKARQLATQNGWKVQ